MVDSVGVRILQILIRSQQTVYELMANGPDTSTQNDNTHAYVHTVLWPLKAFGFLAVHASVIIY